MKVYIVEDHESMRFILKRLLRKNFPSITTIGEGETAETALEEIPSFDPDLILVDISLPGMDGIELIRRLKPLYKNLCILVVTGHEIDLYRESALAAGADEIVSKNDDQKLLKSIGALLEKRERTKG
ncbi:MAG: response regulator [Chitinivibrionales bacterium]|nr:response regulator [Chitinivibrionales bacterium]MBD3358925.1 response regulator [Chitinivibrionales bacterium]